MIIFSFLPFFWFVLFKSKVLDTSDPPVALRGEGGICVLGGVECLCGWQGFWGEGGGQCVVDGGDGRELVVRGLLAFPLVLSLFGICRGHARQAGAIGTHIHTHACVCVCVNVSWVNALMCPRTLLCHRPVILFEAYSQ